jgi:hypothetical protein
MKEKIKTKTDGDIFKEYLVSLSRDERRVMRKKIIAACRIEYPTIDNWRYNICRIPPLAKEKIEELTGLQLFKREEEML